MQLWYRSSSAAQHTWDVDLSMQCKQVPIQQMSQGLIWSLFDPRGYEGGQWSGARYKAEGFSDSSCLFCP